MNKRMKGWGAIVLMLLLCAAALPAHTRRPKPADNYLSFSFFIQPAALGYKHHLGRGFYVTGDLDSRENDKELVLRAGAAYYFPLKVMIFRFYSGGGMQFTRNRSQATPYLVIGTHFLFLYTEIVHPLRSRESAEYRFGFNFRF